MSQIVVSSYVGARMIAWVNSCRTPPTSSGCSENQRADRNTSVPLVHAAPGPWRSTWTVTLRDLLGADQCGDGSGVLFVQIARPRFAAPRAWSCVGGDPQEFRVDGGWTGEDVAGQEAGGAGPVGDDAARLLDQDGARGDVPRARAPARRSRRTRRPRPRRGRGRRRPAGAGPRSARAPRTARGSTGGARPCDGTGTPCRRRNARPDARRPRAARSCRPPARRWHRGRSPPSTSRGGTARARPPRSAVPPRPARPTRRRSGTRAGSSWCRPADRPASSDRTWSRRVPHPRAGCPESRRSRTPRSLVRWHRRPP